MAGRRIRLVVADDHPSLRKALTRFFRTCIDFEIVGEASNGEEAVERAYQLCPDVVVMDIDMPTMNGIEATEHISKFCPGVGVVAYSSCDKEDLVSAIREAGAVAVVCKGERLSQLAEAIRRCANARERQSLIG